MVTIYCDTITPRVLYTMELVFVNLLGSAYFLTSDKKVYEKEDGPKICYGNIVIEDDPFFRASKLLNEDGIDHQELVVGQIAGHPAIFEVEQPSVLTHDLFSAIFYLVSRYEEYLPHEEDEHGRYLANQSLASKHDFLELPIVDIWAMLIGQAISDRYPDLDLGKRAFKYVNTIDIDNAYAFSGKGGLRAAGGIAKSVLKLDKKDVADRVGVLSGGAKDPFDTYAYMKRLALENNSEVKSFVLLGDYGPFDKNLSHSSDKQVQAINQMAEFSEVGIHPSYGSGGDEEGVNKEISRLSDILNRPITSSRQHYLKLKLPETYMLLIENGIREDYSMGYSEAIGFRAGTCTPFQFFNLKDNTSTDLVIYPFSVMDRTLNDYLKLNPEEAIEKIVKLADAVMNVNGTLISVWHNESLSDDREWRGWLPVYEHLQRYSGD
ncbi:MAG: polysaccharide deacetylase family protein [Flavobacteriales bacterium]|nr:polysaccharide deacetylase family protein [Flavobacteriales bacterium]